jgi:DNA-binding response OmpR family regulator
MFISTMQEDAKTILVIDDDIFIRDLVKDVLINRGYKVDLAEDGEVGLSKLEKKYYDLVMLGIMMPKLDGIGVLKKIKEKGLRHGKIVMYTNVEGLEIEKAAFELGADGYEVKAKLTQDQLAIRVDGYLSGFITREEFEKKVNEINK